MKVLVAPDKLKGCLTAADAAEAISAGVRDAWPNADVDPCPMADGGDGTAAVLLAAMGGRFVSARVTGPLAEQRVDTGFVLLGDGTTAVVEIAAASGLALLQPADRDPLATTTFGTGELIALAVRGGARRVILALGGSATIDAGIGCAQACGFTVLMTDGEPTSPGEPLCGRDIGRVLTVKHGRGEVTNGIEVVGACDVSHRLHGPAGAVRAFGPQKGATPAVVEQLDEDLRLLAGRMSRQAEAALFGAGAAGGMGFAVAAYFGGTLTSGFDLVADAVGFRSRLNGADLCLTAEGRLDATTAGGKTVAGVARASAAAGVPCVALVGSVAADAGEVSGLTAHFCIGDGPQSLEEARGAARQHLRRTSAQCVRLWNDGRCRWKSGVTLPTG